MIRYRTSKAVYGLYLCMSLVLIGPSAYCRTLEDAPSIGSKYSIIIEDNELYGNNLAGIRIRGDMPLAIKTCRIHANGRAGIAVDKQAQVMVTGCEVFNNGTVAGITVEEAASITIEDSRIYGNKLAGVRVWGSEQKAAHTLQVKIVNSRIYDNDQGGVRSMPESINEVNLAILGSEIYGNGKGGIRVENDTRLIAKGNAIYNNGTVGIISHESVIPPKLDVYQNTISFNHGPGIHVLNGVTGNVGIRNNYIFNNQRSGVVCGFWGNSNVELLDVDIINNTIVANGSGDQGAGIRNDSKGRAVIMNNIVAYNYVSGIRTRKCDRYSCNLLFANGDVANCCDDPRSAPYWVERVQYAGCIGRGEGDLIADPLFVDIDNYNFALKDGSPAIDAGRDEGVYHDTSLPPSKGTSRNDMGATGGPYAAN